MIIGFETAEDKHEKVRFFGFRLDLDKKNGLHLNKIEHGEKETYDKNNTKQMDIKEKTDHFPVKLTNKKNIRSVRAQCCKNWTMYEKWQ
jgi:hypothetical protein